MQKTMPPPAIAASVAAVLAAGLALAGCGSAATHSATAAATGGAATSNSSSAASSIGGSTGGSSASVPFPVAVGNTWNYKITTAGESGTTINKMTTITPAAGGQQVTMLTTDHLGTLNASAKETYLFRSDGSIGYPLGTFSPGSGVTVTSNGVVWPPASVIASGKPSQSTLNIAIKAAGQNLSTTAHVTVQGDGTATVTVPAGTYQATVVLVTERLEIMGITASIQIKTWLAPNVGPVKELVNGNEGGAASLVADEELLSFTKG